MPKYEEITNILRDRIANGVYPVDSMLPTQFELSKEFGVSRMTIKKAIEILTIEGLIFSKQGNGTRVLNSSFWDKEDSKFRLNNYPVKLFNLQLNFQKPRLQSACKWK